MSSHPPPNGGDVLDGWKNIAEYLGKSPRTAQRWRQEFGMPVHRLGGREGENVYAFRSELDAWRRQASRLGGFTASEQDADDQPRTAAPAPRSDGALRRAVMRFMWGLAAVLLIAVLGLGGWKAVEWGREPGAQGPSEAHGADRQPARWLVVGNVFHAFNAAGERLWTYRPGPMLATSTYVGHNDPTRLPLPDLSTRVSTAVPVPHVFMADIDGDGRHEVLLIAHAQDPVEGSALHCLDSEGALRWTFQPRDPLVFGGEDYGPSSRLPWVVAAEDGRGAWNIWISSEHFTWFPTHVYRLDPSGKELGRYGSNGRINKIRFMSAAGRQFVLLGGVNNERKTAAVAIFDIVRFGGAAPAETPKYRCDNCTPGQPDHYLVFPRTDLSNLRGGMPFVAEFAMQPSGEVVVSVQQHASQLPSEDGYSQALTNYRLGPDFVVHGGEFHSQYIAVHDFYASAGRVDHRFDAAREQAQLWPVLRWNGSGYDRINGPER